MGAALLALVATACGGDDDPEPAETTEDAAEPGDGETTAAPTGDEGTEEAASPFEGETIRFVVPFSPGGGYDSYARMVAPYLEKHLGATVVVENEPGAGGLLAINNLTTAEPDGTTIAIMNAVGAGGAVIAGAEGANFALDELSFIGRLGASSHIIATGADNELATWEDVQAGSGIRFGSTGPGAADFVNANVLIEVFGLDATVVTGFEGSEENQLAVTRGDVDLMSGDFDSRIQAITEGDHRALLLLGYERDEQLPDTPVVMELEFPDDEAAQVMEAQLALLELGRPVVAPAGLPDDRLQALRAGLEAAVNDPDLQSESEQQGRPINWMSGPDLEGLVAELLDAPAAFREVLSAAY